MKKSKKVLINLVIEPSLLRIMKEFGDVNKTNMSLEIRKACWEYTEKYWYKIKEEREIK